MTYDWSWYGGNPRWLPERTIYMTRHGSHAYGTNLPTSDLDLRGIAIAPKEYYLGFDKTFEQFVQGPNPERLSAPDATVYELRKLLFLCGKVNPNALELLYTDPSDHLITSPAMERILACRDDFLSRRAKQTFSGYARSQMERINRHYKWLRNPPTQPPVRSDFKLPDTTQIPEDQLKAVWAMIKKRIDEWNWHELEHLDDPTRQWIEDEFTRRLVQITYPLKWGEPWKEFEVKVWTAAVNSLGFESNFIEYLDRERQYHAELKNWNDYLKWKRERNEARAALEAQWGYDTKHAMHLVRLLRMCREILTEGVVLVRRPDVADLLAIRHGSWTYERLVAWAQEQDLELEEVAASSPLPKRPNTTRINQLCVELAEASF